MSRPRLRAATAFGLTTEVETTSHERLELRSGISQAQVGRVLVNNDWQPHTLGDLQAEQGDTVRISYPSEGRHITGTTLRPDGRVTILVEQTNT